MSCSEFVIECTHTEIYWRGGLWSLLPSLQAVSGLPGRAVSETSCTYP